MVMTNFYLYQREALPHSPSEEVGNLKFAGFAVRWIVTIFLNVFRVF